MARMDWRISVTVARCVSCGRSCQQCGFDVLQSCKRSQHSRITHVNPMLITTSDSSCLRLLI